MMLLMTSYTFNSIGIAHTPFSERFGIPRQAGLVPSAIGRIELFGDPHSGICDGLEAFSHIWLLFMFDRNPTEQWKPKVRPPRLGGNDKVGVFASRSPYRPNPIGMSVVRLLGQTIESGRLYLEVEGVDLMDGTALIDIKPYVPYADRIENCRAEWATEAPQVLLSVSFSDLAHEQLLQYESRHPGLEKLICGVVSHDPRPAYQTEDPDRTYGFCLYELDVQWKISPSGAIITNITPRALDK